MTVLNDRKAQLQVRVDVVVVVVFVVFVVVVVVFVVVMHSLCGMLRSAHFTS